MPGFVDMVFLVDLGHQWIDRLIAHHLEIVEVTEFFDDEHLAEESDFFFALRVLSRKHDLLFRVDFTCVPVAEFPEHDHVLVFFIDEMMKILSDRAHRILAVHPVH